MFLLLLACDSTDPLDPPERPSADTAPTAADPPTARFVTRARGWYGGDGTVTWELGAGGDPESDAPHAHLRLDDVLVADTHETSFDVDDLTSGTHVFHLAPADAEHVERGAAATLSIPVLHPSVTVYSPAESAYLATCSAQVRFATSDFTTASDATPDTFGVGRWEVSVDGVPQDVGWEATADATEMEAGTRVIRVRLVDGDGVPLAPEVSDRVTVVVATGASCVRVRSDATSAPWGSATVPLTIGDVPDGPDVGYTLWVDGELVGTSSSAEAAVTNLPPGEHLLHARLTIGGRETGATGRVRVWITADRPDVVVVSPPPLGSLTRADVIEVRT